MDESLKNGTTTESSELLPDNLFAPPPRVAADPVGTSPGGDALVAEAAADKFASALSAAATAPVQAVPQVSTDATPEPAVLLPTDEAEAPPQASAGELLESDLQLPADVPLAPQNQERRGSATEHFVLEDDSEPENAEPCGADEVPPIPQAAEVVATSSLKASAQSPPEDSGLQPMNLQQQPGASLGEKVRNRFLYLSKEDQHTVCRRECQLAQQAEDALVKQMMVAINQYTQAMDTSKAVVHSVATGACADSTFSRAPAPDAGPDAHMQTVAASMGMSQDVLEKYEGRLNLLLEAVNTIRSEEIKTLPKLTKLESLRGLANAQYARAAIVANTVAKENQELEVGAKIGAGVAGVRGAFAGLASRLKRGDRAAGDPQTTRTSVGNAAAAATGGLGLQPEAGPQ